MIDSELLSGRLKLQHLKVLAALSECGSMTKAAKILSISQPVVSKVIRDLETILGVALFERTAEGVEPTAYGLALLKRSLAVLDDIKASLDEIQFLADPRAGKVRIGSTEPIIAGFGAAIMERLWQQYPQINFEIVQAESARLLNRELPERRIELALLPVGSKSADHDVDFTILFKDRLRVVVGSKNPWARRQSVKLSDLAGDPWCVAPTSIGDLLIEGFRAGGMILPRIAVATSTTHLLFRLLEAGHLVGHFGERLLAFYQGHYDLKFLPVELPVPPFFVAIATVRHRIVGPVAQLFVDTARDLAKPFADNPPTDPHDLYRPRVSRRR